MTDKLKMRQFLHPNMTGGFECPVCLTGKDLPVVLVPIPGTEEGNIQQAKQVHTKCFVFYAKMHDMEVEIEE